MIGALSIGLARQPAASAAAYASSSLSFNTYYGAGTLTFSETDFRVTYPSAGPVAIAWLPFANSDVAFEMEVVVQVNSASSFIGLRQGPAPVASSVSLSTSGYLYISSGSRRINGSEVDVVAACTAGDKITFIYRPSAGTIETWKNGVSQGIFATGVSGYLYPAGESGAGTTESHRLSQASSYTLPAGVRYWL